MVWYSQVETDIFTQIKYRLSNALLTTFPNLYITMDDSVIQEPKFPTVYIHFMQSVELAKNLDGTDVNAIQLTVQYEITVSKEQGMNVARMVYGELATILKNMAFTMMSLADFENNSNDTKRMVGRSRRIIGNGDTI